MPVAWLSDGLPSVLLNCDAGGRDPLLMVAVNRVYQAILVFSTLVCSWLGMQAVHELGHVLGAWCTGGKVAKVVLYPLTISRTELAYNPHPFWVVWAGPVIGVILPVALWGICVLVRCECAYLLRFFARFCLIANGAYISIGAFDRVGDAGEMRRLGSPLWLLLLFGAITMPAGLWLWHRLGSHFGLGSAHGRVSARAAYCMLFGLLLFLGLEFLYGHE
jgi:Peptidase M50B-like